MTDDVQHLIEFLSLPPHAVLEGDCLERVRRLPDNSVDAIVTDPPYGLGKEPDALAMLTDWLGSGHHDVKGSGFMGKAWDAFVPQPALWRECLRVLKPGGHLLAFAGTRTHDLMTLGLRIAGFEIRDTIMWVYGSGFPKSLDVSKAIDNHGGSSVAWFGPWFRQWREANGITQKQVAALFPSKTGGLTGCVANWELGLNMPTPEQFNAIRDRFALPFNSIEAAKREVLRTAAGSRLAVAPGLDNDRGAKELAITAPATDAARRWEGWGTALKPALEPITVARKPLAGTVAANVLAHGTGALNIDGCRVEGPGGVKWESPRGGIWSSDPSASARLVQNEQGRWPANLVHDGSDEVLAGFPKSKDGVAGKRSGAAHVTLHGLGAREEAWGGYGGGGSAARFFYCAKASKADRDEGNTHPTVKPTALMRWLVRLVTPPGGLVLDPFAGSGSTGKACKLEGFRFIGCELDPEYAAIARARIEGASE